MGHENEGQAEVVQLTRRRNARRTSDEPPAEPLSLRQALAQSKILPSLLSACRVMTLGQMLVLLLFVGGSVAAYYYRPEESWLVTRFIFYFGFTLVIVWRLCLLFVATSKRMGLPGRQDDMPGMARVGLPVYSVLVALRDEAGMMTQLARNLSAIDWPAEKLDIILLVEADDEGTRNAAAGAFFPNGTRLLTVPPGWPITKPRALNYGLAYCHGEFVTIYDAEDRPQPGQLREALEAFDAGGPDVVCVQAPLVASNAAGSWLAAHWALEYRVQFGINVPALAELRHPVMLGGTSNHFRRRDLIAIGAWDAWNVTEDADLGIRIARMGGLTEAIRTPTHEAAPETLGVWLSQRSRWIKGYMQTWLVAMRNPVRLLAELGPLRWLSLNLTLLGAILSAFLYGPMIVLVILGLSTSLIGIDPISFGLFGLGWLAAFLTDLLAPGSWSFGRIFALLTRPFYWPLQTLAAVRALIGLAVRPAFWAKTPHQPDDAERVAI